MNPITCECKKRGRPRVKLPKQLVDFLRTQEDYMGKTLEEYIGHEIPNVVKSDLETNIIFGLTQKAAI